jgi:hypothetical protein
MIPQKKGIIKPFRREILFTPKHSNRFMLFIFLSPLVMFIILGIVSPVDIFDVMPMWAGIVVSQSVTFLLPCAVIAVIYRDRLRELFPFRAVSWLNCLLIFGACLFIQPLLMFLGSIMSLFADNNIDAAAREMNEQSGLAVLVVTIAVVPSVFEELAMRGPVLAGYRRKPIFIAALMNGLFFGAMHMDLQQLLYTTVLGAVLAVFALYTRSLIAPMIGHFTLNGTQSLMLAAQMSAGAAEECLADCAEVCCGEAISALDSIIAMGFFTVMTVPLFGLLFIKFIKMNRPESEPADESKIITWEAVTLLAMYLGLVALIIFS